MRNPSSRVLRQSASIYAAISGQDAVGGYSPTYGSSPTLAGVLCSAQPKEYEEVFENNRVTRYRSWELFFSVDPGVMPRDKIVFSAQDGTIHTIYVQTSRDEAGRGMAYAVRGTERQ